MRQLTAMSSLATSSSLPIWEGWLVVKASRMSCGSGWYSTPVYKPSVFCRKTTRSRPSLKFNGLPLYALHGRRLVFRLNSWRKRTMGLRYTLPVPCSSGISSFSASSLGLLVMAPNRAASTLFSISMVRSGSGLASVRQNSQPMSPGTYSASKPSLSSTILVASMTSTPTPSPGIQPMVNLAMVVVLSARCSTSDPGSRGVPGWYSCGIRYVELPERPGGFGTRILLK